MGAPPSTASASSCPRHTPRSPLSPTRQLPGPRRGEGSTRQGHLRGDTRLPGRHTPPCDLSGRWTVVPRWVLGGLSALRPFRHPSWKEMAASPRPGDRTFASRLFGREVGSSRFKTRGNHVSENPPVRWSVFKLLTSQGGCPSWLDLRAVWHTGSCLCLHREALTLPRVRPAVRTAA